MELSDLLNSSFMVMKTRTVIVSDFKYHDVIFLPTRTTQLSRCKSEECNPGTADGSGWLKGMLYSFLQVIYTR